MGRNGNFNGFRDIKERIVNDIIKKTVKMINEELVQKWYSEVFNSELYNEDSYIDYKLFDISMKDWEKLVVVFRDKYELKIMSFDKQIQIENAQIYNIIQSEDRCDYFLEIYLENFTTRIYTNSIHIIEGDIQRIKIRDYTSFEEFVFLMKEINDLLSKEISIFDEMEEELPIFVIG